MDVVLDWNGEDLPAELKRLPKGRYVLSSVREHVRLTQEEEAGIEEALQSLRDGKGVSLEEARLRIERLVQQ